MKITIPLCLLVVVLMLVGCESAVPLPAATATAVSSPTAGPTNETTAVPRPTAAPSPSPTAAPTNSPTPPATATAAATVEPIPEETIEIEGATLPPGFSMIRFADMYRPTGLAFDGDGRLFAASFDGTVRVFIDADGDGRADEETILASGFQVPLGIAINSAGGDVYVSSTGRIDRLQDDDGDLVVDETAAFVTGLPHGLHQNSNLKFGPDGMLYLGVGSTCDVCVEVDPRSGTIMRFDPATGEGEIMAGGMRNPYDLAFHPVTGDLFATDNGRDDLGLDAPHEELNWISEGAHYGWPDCWDDRQGQGCEGTETAVAFFEPHSSANSLDFYPQGGRFPVRYHGDAFVAIFGSWLKSGLTTGVQRVRLIPNEDGYHTETEWFAAWPGMPLGLVVGPDGALYVGDYTNGGIYRISYGP